MSLGKYSDKTEVIDKVGIIFRTLENLTRLFFYKSPESMRKINCCS